MKQITIITCLLLAGYFAFSQEKTVFGITAEGAWFMPHRQEYSNSDNHFRSTKNGFGPELEFMPRGVFLEGFRPALELLTATNKCSNIILIIQ